MKQNNTAILILAGGGNKYSSFIDAVRSSWVADAVNSGIPTFFYCGGAENDHIEGDFIRVKASDSLEHCYLKFLAAVRVLREAYPNVELIFRTNISSYIDMDTFSSFLRTLIHCPDIMCGVQGSAYLFAEKLHRYKFLSYVIRRMRIGPKFNFYSGAGFFIGTNVLDQLKTTPGNYMIDDVEIGYQNLSHIKCSRPLLRVYVTDSFDKMTKKEFDSLVENGLFHYKFKTTNRSFDADCIKLFGQHNVRLNRLTLNDKI